MEYRKKHGICYVSLGGAFPAGAVPVRHPSAPLVILIRRDPSTAGASGPSTTWDS